MKPNAEFRDRLFIGAGAAAARIIEFSCDHIIPPENILPIAVTKGLNNEKLLFNFTNRMSMVRPRPKSSQKPTVFSFLGQLLERYPETCM